ncbi:hypothetical protein [Arenimonas sp. MALMAid1274]|uniref:hypothetical protein n=1 Tax=Arenimonas sp. MALMAid1274 TaxID=3411630 RepID=UPI003BA20278
MNRRILMFALAAALPVGAQGVPHDDVHEHDRVFQRASELVPWCKAEAEAHFVGRGETTYQWTSSYHDRGNVLHVEGKLRVEGADIGVHCRIARGAREQYATIEISDPRA